MAIKITTRIDGTEKDYAEIINHSSNENIILLVHQKDGDKTKTSGIEFTPEQFIDFNKAVSDVYFDKRINELENMLESVPEPIQISIPNKFNYEGMEQNEILETLEKNVTTLESIISKKEDEISMLKNELTLYKNTK